jgi:RNA polymerase sigma factor (sigma-70 family)
MRSGDDTSIGEGDGRFPVTRHSAILAAQGAGEETRRQALDAVIAAYWKPVYKFIRIQWRMSNEDAKDLTQGFFAGALEKRFIDSFNPNRGTFRAYLRASLENFLRNERERESREKRGGGATHLPLDFDGAERELSSAAEVEDLFEQEWTRSVFSIAVERLRTSCVDRGNDLRFALFESFDLSESDSTRPSYRALAERHGLTEATVTNWLAAARRDFRGFALDVVRELTATEEEFRAEARRLFGVEVG